MRHAVAGRLAVTAGMALAVSCSSSSTPATGSGRDGGRPGETGDGSASGSARHDGGRDSGSTSGSGSGGVDGGAYWSIGNGTVTGNGLSCTLAHEIVYLSPGDSASDPYILFVQSGLGASAAESAASIACTGQLADAVMEFEILVPAAKSGTYGDDAGEGGSFSAIQLGAAAAGTCDCPGTGNFCGGEWNLGQDQGTVTVALTSVIQVQTSGGTFYLPHGTLKATLSGQFTCSNETTSFAVELTF